MLGDETLSERVRRNASMCFDDRRPSTYQTIVLPGLPGATYYSGDRRRSFLQEIRFDPDSLHIQDIDDPDIPGGSAAFARKCFITGHDVVLGIPGVDLEIAMEKLARGTEPFHWNDDFGQVRVFHEGREVTETFLRFVRGAA
jgi:hypothetical protein